MHNALKFRKIVFGEMITSKAKINGFFEKFYFDSMKIKMIRFGIG